jgi:UDP-N-acetylmuramate dehydrogenase
MDTMTVPRHAGTFHIPETPDPAPGFPDPAPGFCAIIGAVNYTLTENAPLASRNTLRVPATTRWLAEVQDVASLGDLLARSEAQGPVLVLGAGSNLLLTRDFDGLVIHFDQRGIEILTDGSLRIGAGENWHALVRWTLSHGYCGFENLALIPGTVGAAPIQNIGAYGTELEEFVAAVHAWDRRQNAPVVLGRDECGFAYRDSVFKREPDRWLVTHVEFRLPSDRPLMLDYAGVREELHAMGCSTPTHTDVADAVERLRRRKLPDPADIGNAGSFFKNPVVTRTVADALVHKNPGMPAWDSGSATKLSAAWLLEQCGFKGYRQGDAGFSERHALVLVNHGGASGADLWALAQRAQAEVEQRFGVRLEPEPRII